MRQVIKVRTMRLVGLISGGKDSLYNILQCIAAGHEVVALANIEPAEKDELDSYMYQTVGHEMVSLLAGAIGLPLFREKTKGKAICKSKIYIGTTDDEVEDLFELLLKVKKHILIEGVSVGAIASDYQRTRVEHVCARLNLRSFAYMWKRNQEELLQEMIDADLNAVIIKVACIGLNPKNHLGMSIKDIQPHLLDLNKEFGINVCGEGGEYETFTLDCPLFHRVISIKDSEEIITSNNPQAPVGFLSVKNASLVTKKWEVSDPVRSMQARIKLVRSSVKDPYHYIEDCVDEVTQTLFPEKRERSYSSEMFPFELDQSTSDESKVHLNEYWKEMNNDRPHHVTTQFMINAITRSDLSYTTGWSSIGNVFSSSFGSALQCVQKHLNRIHYEFKDIVFVNLYVQSISEVAALNKIYSQYMPEVLPPARVCVETMLPSDTKIILSIVAHKNISKSRKIIAPDSSSDRVAIHVQSISHWAPASIGPYSQCINIGGLCYVAGQIPLIPGTMEILNKPIYHQCKLALRHVKRILQAVNESFSFANVLQAICYVTSEKIAMDINSLWTYITEVNHAMVSVIVVSALPRHAQLEWEVVACSYNRPSVTENNRIVEDFNVSMKRCVYSQPFASSVVCKIHTQKKGKRKGLKTLTAKALFSILSSCVDFMRNSVSHLCILKLFYKFNDFSLSQTVNEVMHTYMDLKVIVTAVPAVGFEEHNTYIVITGICQ